MPYVPSISDYRPFYIQTAGDAVAWDTRDYGMVAKGQPWPDDAEAKEPYRNDWHDEDGDDEYVGDVFLKAFEYEVEFFIMAFDSATQDAVQVLSGLKRSFREKLLSGTFSFYDSWQGYGNTSLRFVRDKVKERRIGDGWARMTFSVAFKVDDPSATAVLSKKVQDGAVAGYTIVRDE